MKKHDLKSSVLKKTADSLMNELNKADDEIDWEYVKLCEEILANFTKYKKPSRLEKRRRIKEILKRVGAEKRTSPNPIFKPAFAALTACFVLLFSCVTFYVTAQIYKNNSITYVYNGKKTTHWSLDSLLKTENLDLFYPQEFAYGAKISQVRRDDSGHTVFIFDDSRLTFDVCHNCTDDSSQNDNSGSVDFFNMLRSADSSQLCFSINNDFYTITCDSNEQLLKMFESFNFEW